MKAHPGTPKTTPAAPTEIAESFDVNLPRSPWHGGPCPGLRRDTKIWKPEETYLKWTALIFPTAQSLKDALRAFRHTEIGMRCPAHRHLNALILPKEGHAHMAYLFGLVESPMDSDRPKQSVALYHRACVHDGIMERLPSHRSRSALARKLWFRTHEKRRNVRIECSDTFLIAETLDVEIAKLMKDPGLRELFI